MSEFINKSKIAALSQSNADLIDEISALRAECQRLKDAAQPRESHQDNADQLRQTIATHEQRETDLREALELVAWKAKTTKEIGGIVHQLMDALQLADDGSVEVAIDKFYKKRSTPRIAIAFLVGVLSPLMAWHVVLYHQTGELPFTFIERLLSYFGR